MQKTIMNEVEQYAKQNKKRSVWRQFVRVMICLVVFCTTYALILPAITMEKDTYCGVEAHEHTEDCYTQVTEPAAELVCTLETLNPHVHTAACYDAEGTVVCGYSDQILHAHSELCYNADGELICTLPEVTAHVHSEACYAPIPEPVLHVHSDACYLIEQGEMICELEETEGHTHTDACLCVSETPTCGLEETEGHTHGEGCTEQVLICTETDEAHVHTDACWQTNLICTLDEVPAHSHTEECYGMVLCCGQEESEGHTHGEGCYEEIKTLICELTEGEPEPGQEIPAEPELICGREELSLHTHSEACFDAEGQLICGKLQITEHVHTDACLAVPEGYVAEDVLSCTLEENDTHTHSALCYGTWELTCGQEEHVHELICYSDPSADLETSADWEGSLAAVTLTDSWADNVLAIAETQLGYVESASNYAVLTDEDGEEQKKGYTRYGEWYGSPYGDWCAMFASFCLRYADIDWVFMPSEANCERWISLLQQEEYDLFRQVGDYIPNPGDLIFFDWDQDGIADHVGFVKELYTETEQIDGADVEIPKIRTIEGNASDSVRYVEYEQDSVQIAGYADLNAAYTAYLKTLPGYYQCGMEEHTHAVECLDENGQLSCGMEEHVHTDLCVTGEPEEEAEIETIALLPEYHYEDENLEMTIRVDGEAKIVETVTESEPAVPAVPEETADPAEQTEPEEAAEVSNAEEPAETAIEPAAEEAEAEEPAEPEEAAEVSDAEEPAETAIEPAAEEAEAEETAESEETAEEPAADEAETEESAEPAEPEEPEVFGPDAPILEVIPIDSEDGALGVLKAYLDENGDPDDLINLTALELNFTYQGKQLDVSDCEITAEITPKAPIVEPAVAALASLEEEASEESDVGVQIAMLQSSDESVTQLDAVFLETQAETPAVMTLTASVDESAVLAVAATQTANPHFTVQYYTYLDRLVLYDSSQSGKTNLSIINTDNGGNNLNGNLPKNGATLDIDYLVLGSDNKPITQSVLTETYASQEYEYIMAPNPAYFNRLYENGNYVLSEVWILGEGKDPLSINEADWVVHENVSDLHFTNRPQSAINGTILISDDTVIRMVYTTSNSTFRNGATFYDYDITNGLIYATFDDAAHARSPISAAPAAGPVYQRTDDGSGTVQYGINHASNYSTTGSKLAFGNNNTYMGLAGVTWKGQTLNKFNSVNSNNGAKGTTFGLVTGLKNGRLQYAAGVSAPPLFNEGEAEGKETLDGYNLTFARSGDSYTLAKVQNENGTTVAKNLDKMTEASGVWANHFWPMDTRYDYTNNYVLDHDMKTGNKAAQVVRAVGVGSGLFPESDNGIPHNSYFGMNYSVEFTLTEDYVGPLEYLFFGDDDLWVFLDDELICDIGGVHISVGEYVNLWDWIPKGSSGTHKLSVFYTERGASGSSCYMHFTLPSVSSIVPERNTGNLRVDKKVTGIDSGETEFAFDILFKDQNGNPMRDDYAYTRYDANGNVIMHDIIISDGGSFSLKANEYVIIKYLPIGTIYTITESEASTDGFIVSIDSTNGTSSGTTVTGRIIQGTVTAGANTVNYHNDWYYELPETGGPGTILYTTAGFLLSGSAAYLMYKRKRRREDA